MPVIKLIFCNIEVRQCCTQSIITTYFSCSGDTQVMYKVNGPAYWVHNLLLGF